MTEIHPPITHFNQDIPLMKILHLRESLFIVAYVSGLIQMVDFENPFTEQPLASYQIEHADLVTTGMNEEQTDSNVQEESDVIEHKFVDIRDINVLHKNEEKLIIGFRDLKIAFLNIHTQEF